MTANGEESHRSDGPNFADSSCTDSSSISHAESNFGETLDSSSDQATSSTSQIQRLRGSRIPRHSFPQNVDMTKRRSWCGSITGLASKRVSLLDDSTLTQHDLKVNSTSHHSNVESEKESSSSIGRKISSSIHRCGNQQMYRDHRDSESYSASPPQYVQCTRDNAMDVGNTQFGSIENSTIRGSRKTDPQPITKQHSSTRKLYSQTKHLLRVIHRPLSRHSTPDDSVAGQSPMLDDLVSSFLSPRPVHLHSSSTAVERSSTIRKVSKLRAPKCRQCRTERLVGPESSRPENYAECCEDIYSSDLMDSTSRPRTSSIRELCRKRQNGTWSDVPHYKRGSNKHEMECLTRLSHRTEGDQSGNYHFTQPPSERAVHDNYLNGRYGLSSPFIGHHPLCITTAPSIPSPKKRSPYDLHSHCSYPPYRYISPRHKRSLLPIRSSNSAYQSRQSAQKRHHNNRYRKHASYDNSAFRVRRSRDRCGVSSFDEGSLSSFSVRPRGIPTAKKQTRSWQQHPVKRKTFLSEASSSFGHVSSPRLKRSRHWRKAERLSGELCNGMRRKTKDGLEERKVWKSKRTRKSRDNRVLYFDERRSETVMIRESDKSNEVTTGRGDSPPVVEDDVLSLGKGNSLSCEYGSALSQANTDAEDDMLHEHDRKGDDDDIQKQSADFIQPMNPQNFQSSDHLDDRLPWLARMYKFWWDHPNSMHNDDKSQEKKCSTISAPNKSPNISSQNPQNRGIISTSTPSVVPPTNASVGLLPSGESSPDATTSGIYFIWSIYVEVLRRIKLLFCARYELTRDASIQGDSFSSDEWIDGIDWQVGRLGFKFSSVEEHYKHLLQRSYLRKLRMISFIILLTSAVRFISLTGFVADSMSDDCIFYTAMKKSHAEQKIRTHGVYLLMGSSLQTVIGFVIGIWGIMGSLNQSSTKWPELFLTCSAVASVTYDLFAVGVAIHFHRNDEVLRQPFDLGNDQSIGKETVVTSIDNTALLDFQQNNRSNVLAPPFHDSSQSVVILLFLRSVSSLLWNSRVLIFFFHSFSHWK